MFFLGCIRCRLSVCRLYIILCFPALYTRLWSCWCNVNAVYLCHGVSGSSSQNCSRKYIVCVLQWFCNGCCSVVVFCAILESVYFIHYGTGSVAVCILEVSSSSSFFAFYINFFVLSEMRYFSSYARRVTRFSSYALNHALLLGPRPL